MNEWSAAGISTKPSTEEKTPGIEATEDLRTDSRSDFDAAAQLQDEFGIVSVEDEDTARTTGEGAEEQVAAKTADDGGESYVDNTTV